MNQYPKSCITDLFFGFFWRSFRSSLWIALMMAVMLTTLAGAKETETATIQHIEINILNPPQGSDVSNFRYQARQFIGLHSGDPLTEERIDTAIDRLKQSRQFQSIHIDTKDTDGGTVLIFTLEPARRIKNVKYRNNFPLFEREIRRIVSLRPGDMYVEDEIPVQKERLEERYRREGYIAPEVTPEVVEDPQTGSIIVTFHVNKGRYYRIQSIGFTGNRAVATSTLKWKMSLWFRSLFPFSVRRYIPSAFKNDIQKLIRYYRKKGFASASVEQKVSLDEENATADISVIINEGPEYQVEFIGNDLLSDRRLKKDLSLFDKGDMDGYGVRKTIREVTERYHQAGFLKVDVKIETDDIFSNGQPVRLLTFHIDEGPRTLVEKVQVDGNLALPANRIKEQMLTRPSGLLEEGAWDPKRLDEDIQAIQSLYLTNGFRNARIQHNTSPASDGDAVNVVVDIREGNQTLVTDIRVQGLGNVLSKSDALSVFQMKPGTPYREYMRTSDGNLLSAVISEKGYPHVRVESETEFNPDETEARILYRVDPGPFVKMGDVFFAGNLKTDEIILRREIRLKKGAPFSLRKMLEAQQRIRELKVVESADFRLIGLKEKNDVVHLMCKIQEHAPYYFQTSLGYETDTGLYYEFEAGNINLLGANKKGWISASSSEIGEAFELGLSDPSLYGTPISMNAALYKERTSEFNQNFETDSFGTSFFFSQKRTESLQSGIGFRLEQRQQFLTDEAEPSDTIDYERRTLIAVTPQIRFDTRDSFIRPKHGFLSIVSVDISKGIENDLDDFYKYELDFRWYRNVTDWLTFAFMAKFGYIVPYNDSKQVAKDQLFFLGGIGDVRGFDENLLRFDTDNEPLGGKNAVSGTVEARIDLGHNLEMALFLDSGKIGGTVYESESDEFRSSVGMGLRYLTPIGPIGLLYGHKLDPKQGESNGRFHFAIGYTF